MVDYVDIRETFLVAGDYDSRKRYLRKSASGNSIAVCSGVTWRIGDGGVSDGESALAWRWSLGSRGSAVFKPWNLKAPTPSPLRITDCKI